MYDLVVLPTLLLKFAARYLNEEGQLKKGKIVATGRCCFVTTALNKRIISMTGFFLIDTG